MRCYLHIGGEKTGTTSLQEFLHLNRERLLLSGVLFTRSAGQQNDRDLALAAYPLSRRDDYTNFLDLHDDRSLAEYQRRITAGLKEEIRGGREAGCSRIIFSSEHLQSRLKSDNDVQRLREILLQLGLEEVTVIYYVRNPVLVAQSLYSTTVKSGVYMEKPPEPDNAYFRHVCDHAGTLQRYGGVFGQEKLQPRLFNRKDLRNGSVIDDFLEVAGIRLEGEIRYPKALNESLSAYGLNLLNRVNRHFPERLSPGIQLNRASLVSLFEEHFAEPKYQFPEPLQLAYEEAFAASNEYVRKTFFSDREKLFEPVSRPGADPDPSPPDVDEALAGLIYGLWKSGYGEGSDSDTLGSRAGLRISRLIRRMRKWRSPR